MAAVSTSPTPTLSGDTLVVYTSRNSRRTSLEVEIDERNDLDAAERAILAALAGIDEIHDDATATGQGSGLRAGIRQALRPFLAWAGPRQRILGPRSAVRAIRDALRGAEIDMATPRLEAELMPTTPGRRGPPRERQPAC